jgi:phosphoribosyl 1,2-cyclic phosphodiesterase
VPGYKTARSRFFDFPFPLAELGTRVAQNDSIEEDDNNEAGGINRDLGFWSGPRYAQRMVRFTVLASGSKGNSTVITGGDTRVLVDAGLSCRELFSRMAQAGEEPETLDAIIISHEHTDHVNGVPVTARKLGIPVYFTEGTHRAWTRVVTPQKRVTYAQWLQQCRQQAADRLAHKEAQGLEVAELFAEANSEGDGTDVQREEFAPETECLYAPASVQAEAKEASPKDDPAWLPKVEYFKPGERFRIGDIAVSPFTIPHDAADPVGFVFEAEGVRMAVATDLGYLPPNVKAQLAGADLLLIESNHDLEMLRDGPYPWQVKQRVLSRVGHLSNDAMADYLEKEYDGGAAYIILAHLSESNNLPELARVAAERALRGRGSLLANRLLLAAQHEPLSTICL